jgi:hypothetical protein
MATFTTYLQGSSDTEVEATDELQFAGGSFDDPIVVSSYNDSTHVKSAGDADDSSGNTPNNVKFISQSGGTGGDSQADWGDGTEDLDQITNGECTLKINFSHGSSVACSSVELFAYDGTTEATAPTDMDVYAAEQGDTNWTNIDGSGSALSLDDSGSSTSHDFYIPMSASPSAVSGEVTSNKFKFSLIYA